MRIINRNKMNQPQRINFAIIITMSKQSLSTKSESFLTNQSNDFISAMSIRNKSIRKFENIYCEKPVDIFRNNFSGINGRNEIATVATETNPLYRNKHVLLKRGCLDRNNVAKLIWKVRAGVI